MRCTSFWSANTRKQHSATALSLVQVAACAAMAWVMAGVAAAIRWQAARFEWRWELYLGILICAVFATAIAFSIQLWAQRYTTPSHAAILFTLEPVFAVITSYILIRERLGGRAILGAASCCRILIAELLGPPAAPESPEPTFEGRVYLSPGGGSKKQKLKNENISMAVGVVLHVYLVVHRGGAGVSFFVSIDVGDVLHARPDSSRPLSNTSLRDGAISNLNISPCLSAMVWFGRFTVSEIAFLFLGALKELFDCSSDNVAGRIPFLKQLL